MSNADTSSRAASSSAMSSSRSSLRHTAPRGGPLRSHSDTVSSATLPQPHEPSLTATGRSTSPLDTVGPSGTHTASAAASRSPPLPATTPAPATTASAAAFPAAVSVPHDVRETVEYQAAWDLELWKAVQADRFRQQLEKQKRVAVAELEKAVKRRERAAAAELAVRTQAVAEREENVKAAEAQLAARAAKVADSEKEVRRMRQQLLDAQQRVEDEVRAQVRLANDTIAHRARLLEERVKAAEAQAKRADERQRQAQEEYLSLYEAFSRYRTHQLTTAAAASAGSCTSGAGGFLAMSSTGPSSGPAFQLDQLRAQWDAEHQLQLQRQEQRHAADTAALQTRCRDLEEQNRRLTAALARRREQLRHVKESAAAPAAAPRHVNASSLCVAQQQQTVATAAAGVGGPCADDGGGHTTAAAVAAQETRERIVRELHRLQVERGQLVEGSHGALRESDTVIVRLDARVRELQAQLSSLKGDA